MQCVLLGRAGLLDLVGSVPLSRRLLPVHCKTPYGHRKQFTCRLVRLSSSPHPLCLVLPTWRLKPIVDHDKILPKRYPNSNRHPGDRVLGGQACPIAVTIRSNRSAEVPIFNRAQLWPTAPKFIPGLSATLASRRK